MKTEDSQPSAEYLAALAVSNEASKAFRVVTLAYRAQTIGDAEYLAARAIHDKAQETFDAAYLKETANDFAR